MYVMDTKAYLLHMFISQIVLFYIFFSMYEKKVNPTKDKLLTVSVFILQYIASSFIYEWSYFLFIFSLYFILNKQKKINNYLISLLVLSCLVIFIIGVVTSSLFIYFMKPRVFNLTDSYLYSLLQSGIYILLAIIYLYFYKKLNIQNLLIKDKSPVSTILLSYLYLVILSFMEFIQHFKAYRTLIKGILLFLIIQIFLVTLLFMYDRKHQKELYEKRLSTNQIKNMKIYTDKIEHDYKTMRHFKHNYKNVLLSLREAIEKEDYIELSKAMDRLEDHSTKILDNDLGNLFKNLVNLKNSYLKSLYVEKLNEMHQKNITCTFECIDEIVNSSDNIFDIITILGIALDNAIESAENQSNGKIQLAIFIKDNLFYYLINNTVEQGFNVNNIMNEGYTSKKNHTGLGLPSIEKIKEQHPEIITTINVKDDWFKFQLTTPIKKED